ncbi:MAG: hypothetical protein U0487_01805 [Patescibacteria group bacterium]
MSSEQHSENPKSRGGRLGPIQWFFVLLFLSMEFGPIVYLLLFHAARFYTLLTTIDVPGFVTDNRLGAISLAVLYQFSCKKADEWKFLEKYSDSKQPSQANNMSVA